MNSLLLPIIMWGSKPPTHKIQSITMTHEKSKIITGCSDGQLLIWDVNDDLSNLTPKSMLFGHSASIVSIVTLPNKRKRSKNIVSASSNGEICLWDLDDGRCIEETKVQGCPTTLQTLNLKKEEREESLVVCFGQFAEILILNPTTLNVMFPLVSRIYPDWIACCCTISTESDTSIIGITVSGTIKVWQIARNGTLPNAPVLEDESKQLRCTQALDIRYIQYAVNLLLVICAFEWQLYDASDFSLLCSIPSLSNAMLSGGDIIPSSDMIVIWDKNSIVYSFKMPFDPTDERLSRQELRNYTNLVPNMLYSFNIKEVHDLSLPPVIELFHFENQSLLISGNSQSRISAFKFDRKNLHCADSVSMVADNSLTDLWNSLTPKPSGVIDHIVGSDLNSTNVTTSLYLENLGQLACGRDDGTIIVVSAVKACRSHLLKHKNKRNTLSHRTLRGHQAAITCLLYPYQESNRYSPQILASGGADFTVILWEIITGAQLHTFTVHGGDITQLIVPPNECSLRVQQSICCVAADHSVSLLSIKERKCIMLASSHTATVTTIKWRPLDDFMLVVCFDGGVYVWQMETGHLDRHVSGLASLEILEVCDECRSDNVVHGTVNLSQAFKRHSLAVFKVAAQQGIKNIIDTIGDKIQEEDAETNVSASSCNNAMLIQPIRASASHDSDSHIVFFNTEVIIGTLLQEHAMRKKQLKSEKRTGTGGTSNPARKVLNAFIYQVRNQLLDSSDPSSALSSPREQNREPQRRSKKEKSPSIELDSIMHVAQLFLSCFHGWSLDEKLDEICREQLFMFEPIVPICFGLLSRDGHMALMLPSWGGSLQHNSHKDIMYKESQIHLSFGSKTNYGAANGQAYPNSKPSHHTHWEISKSITTQHLISVIAVSNTMMELSDIGFVKNSGVGGSNETDESLSENQIGNLGDSAQVKQGWSLISTLHCVLLPELLNSSAYRPPKLELLARRWQDRCLEVREAAQALMLAKLRQIGPEGRRSIVREWSRHMPDYVEQQHIGLIPNSRTDTDNGHPGVSGPSTPADDTGDTSSIASAELATEATGHRNGQVQKFSYETRRRQATAVIILGVIGAEFGQEMDPPHSNTPSPIKAMAKMDVPEGFGISNYSLARHTCKALVYLLLHPTSPRLPAHAPIRRAAIDLLGRGFTVWEPYIEVSAVLLGLLELCIDYDIHIASIQSGLPLSAKADSCRSSHHALCLIAAARPLTFITTIAREVARHNAAALNPQHQALLATSILVRSKNEVLRIIELLAEKMMCDVMDLLIEVVDIILFCIDTTSLRTSNSLIEAVPALSRFHTVSYDPRSRRIAVGTRSGSIYMYDLRTNKHTRISKNPNAITTLAFSPEGKYLSVYSIRDNILSFWMTSSSLFGMIQSQVKCVKTIRPLPSNVCQRLVTSPDHTREFYKNSIRLSWSNSRITVLTLPDRSEYRCHV